MIFGQFFYMIDDSFLWIPILGGFVMFYVAWGIGANDAANSFATSVGAKVLTMNQALIVAAIFEFLGAFLMGSQVTKTIRKNIVDIDSFEDQPEILMFGMLTALFGTGIWLMIATWFKLPVSTTHSTIGSIIGFALVVHGRNAVDWDKIIQIVISWVISPLFSGCLSAILFLFVKYVALVRPDPVKQMLKPYVFPLLVFLTVWANVFFIIYKGTPVLKLDDTPLSLGLGLSAAGAFVVAVLAYIFLVPWLRKRSELPNRAVPNTIAVRPAPDSETKATDIELSQSVTVGSPGSGLSSHGSNVNLIDLTNKDTAQKLKSVKEAHDELSKQLTEERIQKHHQHSRVFSDRSERLFSQLQVFTACFSAFAHGANDVANAIGPFAAIIAIYDHGIVNSKSDVPIWILLIGGVGIVIGLGTWGYKIIERIGRELTKVTPSRGFTIELASATTVVIASRIGIPISTTHSQVGAVTGCGLVDGHKNVDWMIFLKIIASWLVTLPIAGLIAAGLFSFGVYSPEL